MRRAVEAGVVIPAYNAARWLGEALESVLAHRRALDVVVVDDGSSDDTAGVAQRFGAPVRLLRGDHRGTGMARNRGIEEVTGPIVAFLDADDRFTSDGLTVALDYLADHPAVELLFGQARRFSHTIDGHPVASGPLHDAELPGAMVVRRATLARVGPFPAVSIGEGLHWLLRARELGVTEATLSRQLQWRRVHDDNCSVRNRGDIGEFARAIKASLDRRRAAAGVKGEA